MCDCCLIWDIIYNNVYSFFVARIIWYFVVLITQLNRVIIALNYFSIYSNPKIKWFVTSNNLIISRGRPILDCCCASLILNEVCNRFITVVRFIGISSNNFYSLIISILPILLNSSTCVLSFNEQEIIIIIYKSHFGRYYNLNLIFLFIRPVKAKFCFCFCDNTSFFVSLSIVIRSIIIAPLFVVPEVIPWHWWRTIILSFLYVCRKCYFFIIITIFIL